MSKGRLLQNVPLHSSLLIAAIVVLLLCGCIQTIYSGKFGKGKPGTMFVDSPGTMLEATENVGTWWEVWPSRVIE